MATTNPAYQRMQNILNPFIVPVPDDFTVETRKEGKYVFAIVTHAKYYDTNRVTEWLNAKVLGSWVVPTITVAGDEWRLNPRYTDKGWQWLFLKAE